MANALEILKKPPAGLTPGGELYMVAGWDQWADAGSISSELPDYLIEQTNAQKIARIRPDGFYIFQAPGTHHYLRPVIKLEKGHCKAMEVKQNDFYYTADGQSGLVIFKGEEPHLDVERYCDTFLDAVQAFGVRRIVMVGGVFGSMPYDRDRQVSCVYSLPSMQSELETYAVRFSDYEGGVTIGSYMAHRAESRGIEAVVLYAFVPAYDFSGGNETGQGVRIDTDYRAWFELMRRINHMFGLSLSLSELRNRSETMTTTVEERLDEMARANPKLKIADYLQEIAAEFEDQPFMPLDDVWERELKDLFGDGPA